jgi:hypothetical protein
MSNAASITFYLEPDTKVKADVSNDFVWLEAGSITTGGRFMICMTHDQARNLAASILTAIYPETAMQAEQDAAVVQ